MNNTETKKEYNKPVLEIEKFDTEDIMSASSTDTAPEPEMDMDFVIW